MPNTVADFIAAIVQQESGGNYHAVSPDGALGKYQIMPANIPQWSRDVLGHSITAQQYLDSPALQDKIGQAKLSALYNKYGARGAAAAWYSGSASNANNYSSDSGGAGSAGSYADSVMWHMGAPRNSGSAPTHAHAVPTLSGTQKRQALEAGAHDLYALASSVPELSGLITKAITSGQTAADFANAVEGSHWYRTHSDSVRNQLVMKQSDPATYHQNLLQASNHVSAVAQQLGVNVGKYASAIGTRYLAEGWNDDQLKQYFESAHGVTWTWGGATGAALGQLKQLSLDYGVPMGDQTMMHWAKEIALGRWSTDQFKLDMQNNASHIYPGLAKQLASGQTTRQLADPYIQTYAQTLEVNPNSINFATDPLVKRALQTPAPPTTATPGAKPGKAGAVQPPGTTPLWQFEQQLKQDPRWDRTNNAKSATAGMLSQLGQAWGYSS